MDWVQLLEEPQPVTPPKGLIYSTKPLHARATDGHTYILKGPETSVVFAEAACYQLAAHVGLSVPPCRLCTLPGSGGVLFASRELRTRSALETLVTTGKVLNPELLEETIAFDVWVANEDRNMGNIVGEPRATNGTGTVKLYAIDFEKAAVLAGTDRFTVTAMPAARFWPTGVLGDLCGSLTVPTGFCARISAVQRAAVAGLVQQTVWDLNMPQVPWIDTAIDVLVQRASRIVTLVNEVWND